MKNYSESSDSDSENSSNDISKGTKSAQKGEVIKKVKVQGNIAKNNEEQKLQTKKENKEEYEVDVDGEAKKRDHSSSSDVENKEIVPQKHKISNEKLTSEPKKIDVKSKLKKIMKFPRLKQIKAKRSPKSGNGNSSDDRHGRDEQKLKGKKKNMGAKGHAKDETKRKKIGILKKKLKDILATDSSDEEWLSAASDRDVNETKKDRLDSFVSSIFDNSDSSEEDDDSTDSTLSDVCSFRFPISIS